MSHRRQEVSSTSETTTWLVFFFFWERQHGWCILGRTHTARPRRPTGRGLGHGIIFFGIPGHSGPPGKSKIIWRTNNGLQHKRKWAAAQEKMAAVWKDGRIAHGPRGPFEPGTMMSACHHAEVTPHPSRVPDGHMVRSRYFLLSAAAISCSLRAGTTTRSQSASQWAGPIRACSFPTDSLLRFLLFFFFSIFRLIFFLSYLLIFRFPSPFPLFSYFFIYFLNFSFLLYFSFW